ncbi:ClC family H(+)/Cl(-) exchange transporter [Tuanshanicoccus lijuaniae]|uniref:ClC family H(+)/Cl(-) exchange transporter n=1 Tax=Aerococcaceae bacterium zg-1292 TaxID=2774330 RepID=UPI001BD84B2E|nr:ClC family H(+)/Cl(-) exchange transporter [Aerococcaceae bacterium zg-A91]MBS4458475.1 ClC family H(+)/Cl(-) exchange transporter [Aerococcaceae bacterium zg-BR33]
MIRKHQNVSVVSRKSKYIIAGVAVGLCAGFVVSAFRWLITKWIDVVLEVNHFLTQHWHQPWWLLLWMLVSLILAIILGLIVKSEPHIKGSGIPQVELQLQGKLSMNWWRILWKKFVGGALAIGSGLILGREGPSIQLGAAVGQGVASTLKSNKVQENVLISAGAGAGLAAAFNAPIAGLMFVLEEVHHNFSRNVVLTTLTAGLVSNFVSLQFFGLTPSLNLGNYEVFPVHLYWVIVILGVVLGLLGWLYQQGIFALPKIYSTLFPKVPKHFYSVIGFLIMIPIGLYSQDLLFGGGELVFDLVEKQPAMIFLFGLFICRFILAMMSYGTGLPGGIFLPILSLGAIIGSLFGEMAVSVLHVPEAYYSSFVIYAMAGYFAAIGKAPLTSLLLVTEMVGGLNQLMPLGICVLSAYLTAEFLKMAPIYEVLAEKMSHDEDDEHTGRRTVFEVPVPVESKLVGRMVKEIAWPKDIIIATIRRGEKEFVTKGDLRIQAGDLLIVVTDEGHLAKMQDAVNHLAMMEVELQ